MILRLLVLLLICFSNFAYAFDFSGIIIPDQIDDSIMSEVEDFIQNQKKIDTDIKEEVSRVIPSEIKEGINTGACGDVTAFKGRYLYFFSFSMPENSIKNALRTALQINDKYGSNRVVMVVNGFKDNNLIETFKYMAGLMKETEFKRDLPIEMNPDLFEFYNVKAVPVLIKDTNDSAFCSKALSIAKGDTGIRYLIEKLESSDPGPHGNLYQVAEKSVVDFFKEKLKYAIDKMQHKKPEEILAGAYTIKKRVLPEVDENKKYCFDPSIVLKRDILDQSGNVIAPKGTKVNPLDHIKIGRYIVIDGDNTLHMKYAAEGNFDKIMIASGDAFKLMRTSGRRIYFATEEIIDRFKIKKVPAVITQEGKEVCIEEIKLKATSN